MHKYWSGLPFPPPMDHVLSELFTITHLSWVALHSMDHSFIKLGSLLCHGKAVIHEGGSMNARSNEKIYIPTMQII